MERQPQRLVETIFGDRKNKPEKPRHIPSLFHPVKPPQSGSGETKPKANGSGVRKRHPIGLDFGTTSLKWVQLGEVSGRTHIVSLGHEPLRLSPAISEKAKHAELQETLRKVAGQHRLEGQVVLSLPLEDVSLRLLKLSPLAEEEMEQAIRWQVEQTLPAGVSYDDFSVDYVPLPEISNEWKSHVLVAFVPRQRVMTLVDHARSAGFQPVAIEIDPFALFHYLSHEEGMQSGETALLLHLGAFHSSFSIVVKNQLVLGRSLLTTGHSLTNVVADFLRVSREEAEKLLQTEGLTADRPVARALASPLENLIMDVLHAFSSFTRQVAQPAMRFHRVYLGGGVAQMPGLGPWLQSRLGAPVELANPLALFPLEESLARSGSWGGLSAHFAVAMGLALRERDSSG